MDKSNRPATIKDVAREANVSTATVSHVLNKTRYVSEELTEQVQQAIKRLGYYPNLLVGGLRRKKTFTIGLILPCISNETFGLLAEKIQAMLMDHHYNLIICNTSYDIEIENFALDTLIMKQVDAIIAIPTSIKSKKLLEVNRMGIPIILVDRRVEGLNTDSVSVDNYAGAFNIVKHLINSGHRNIAYIDRKTVSVHSIDQKKGYIDALMKSGLTVKTNYIVEARGFDYSAGYEAAKSLITSNSEITAIFGYYDIIAFGAMRAVFDLGLNVPNDISVVGFDGMPFTSSSTPRLTTVVFPTEELAKAVVNITIKRVKEKQSDQPLSDKKYNKVFAPVLSIRESTASISISNNL